MRAAVARQLEAATRKQPFLFTVLVAEDDSAVRDIVAHALTENGFAVLTAPDAQAALRILAKRPVDLLFADIVMPGMDGVELAKVFCPGIKVLFATGYPQAASERNAAGLKIGLRRRPLSSAQRAVAAQASSRSSLPVGASSRTVISRRAGI